MKACLEYNKKIWNKTYDYFKKKYHLEIEMEGEVSKGFYNTRKSGQIDWLAIKQVMELPNSNQIMQVLEKMYNDVVDKMNADLDKKKVPKRLRFKKSFEVEDV